MHPVSHSPLQYSAAPPPSLVTPSTRQDSCAGSGTPQTLAASPAGTAASAERSAMRASSTDRARRSSDSRIADASAATAVRTRKKNEGGRLLYQEPMRPAVMLPVKIARYHAATVVAPSFGGARRAKRPSPVGRM